VTPFSPTPTQGEGQDNSKPESQDSNGAGRGVITKQQAPSASNTVFWLEPLGSRQKFSAVVDGPCFFHPEGSAPWDKRPSNPLGALEPIAAAKLVAGRTLLARGKLHLAG
jgi:hypothetical protein